MERGESLRAAYLAATSETIDSNALNLSDGVSQTTRGVYRRKQRQRHMAYFEAAAKLDSLTDLSGVITFGFHGAPYVTNEAIWTHTLGDKIIRFTATGRYLVIFRYAVTFVPTSNPNWQQFNATSQTIDNALSATDLFWAAASAMNTDIGFEDGATMGTISCIINTQSDLVDGGFRVRYSWSNTSGIKPVQAVGFSGNISIMGPII